MYGSMDQILPREKGEPDQAIDIPGQMRSSVLNEIPPSRKGSYEIGQGEEDDSNHNIDLPNGPNGLYLSELCPKIKKKAERVERLKRWTYSWTLGSFFFKGIVIIFCPIMVWTLAYILTKDEALPGGSIFVLILLLFGGRIIGHFVTFIKLPPMVGMLGIGLLIRNTPHFDFGKHLNPAISAPVRQMALAIILTRAGLGLNLNTLIKMKGLVLRMALFPTLIETGVIATVSFFLLDFPPGWGLLLGFVLSAVSPAVVVPRLLWLNSEGYGVDKGIPTVLIAAASLDNIFAISSFGVTLGILLSGNSMLMNCLQAPLEIIFGVTFGVIWGIFLGLFFNRLQNDKNLIALRTLFTFLGGTSFLIGFNQLGYSGAGALGCLLSSFVAACLWREREVTPSKSLPSNDPVIWTFFILWYIFEPLLFGVIGCAIDLSILKPDLILYGSITILLGAISRLAICYGVSHLGSDLNVKEKLFMGISWIPKATVQAAIGPAALDAAMKLGREGEDVELGQKVLTLAVLVILLTAPIGELCVILLGPKLLQKNRI